MIAVATSGSTSRPRKDQRVLVGERNGKPRYSTVTCRLDPEFRAEMDEAISAHEVATGEKLSISDLIRLAVAEFIGVEGVMTTKKGGGQRELPLKGGSSRKKI